MSHGHQKKYQQIISDVLSGCEGVANIADDLVVFGKGMQRSVIGVCLRSLRD